MSVVQVPMSPTSSSTSSSTRSSRIDSRTRAELGPVPRVAARAVGTPCRAAAETTVYPPPTTGPDDAPVIAPPGVGTLLTWRGMSMRMDPVDMKHAGRKRVMQ